MQEFKKFIMKGNVVDLAVGVVVGVAFGVVVSALVENLITPLISAIGGQPDFSTLSFTINGSEFLYGDFLNVLISFVMIATVVFFFVIQPINKLTAMANRRKTTDDSTTKKCPECFSEIPAEATRCAFCTSKIK